MSNEPTGYVPPPEAAGLTGLGGLDPRELLKGGLNSIPKQSKWTPPEPAELAALLPKYEIEALIGHGGMGAVYKGRQPDLDRAVAFKLLPAELTVDGDFVERFKREAKMLAKLQYPGIVAVFETGQTSAGHLYFVMEFVDGTDLAQVIHGVGLQPVRALEIGTQICDALNYAHKHGVIHRDIKPANVLLNREGRAKLADFGLAKPEESGIGANLTAPQVIMGTPSYMAPEAKAGKSDERSDIFSLGVMLYEMLTGQTPAGVFSPASQRGQVDIRIDDVVLKAMQQQPERRYQQASEFKTDVDTIRVGPAPVVKKSRLPVWLGIAAVVGLGGFFWWGK